MTKEVLQHIDGIEIYPLIALIICFLIFISVIIIWFRKSKSEIESYASLALDNDTNNDKGSPYESR